MKKDAEWSAMCHAIIIGNYDPRQTGNNNKKTEQGLLLLPSFKKKKEKLVCCYMLFSIYIYIYNY